MLHDAGIRAPAVASLMLWGGVAFDTVVGLLLCFAPLRAAATIALAATLAMTAITTILLPSMWLDPLVDGEQAHAVGLIAAQGA